METLMDFALFVLNILLWYLVINAAANLILAYFDYRKIKSKFEIERKELKEHIKKIVHNVNQERHGEVYYWFDADSDQFLAQGSTDEEIRQHLLSRFKGHVFILDNDRVLAGPALELTPIETLKLNPDGKTIN